MTSTSVDHQPTGFIPCDETPELLQKTPSLKEQDQPHTDASDADSDVPAHEAKTTSEKRRRQNQILKAFAANISAHVTQEEITEAATRNIREEQLSIREILARQESSVRITTPRDYQTELFQRAKRENTIAVLDTGSGKTHIATLLLQHILDEELANRVAGGIHKTAFFLVRPSSGLPVSS
jgi:endoribonuclease Dicer